MKILNIYRILNLYGGIGGNRSLWGDQHEITMVEYDPDIAAIYQKRFPNDTVIVGDALEYCRFHANEFDFIWASPPCQTHTNFVIPTRAQTGRPLPIPDMNSLYGLRQWLMDSYNGKWVIENVKNRYKDMPKSNVILGRHQYWSNFLIPKTKFKKIKNLDNTSPEKLAEFHNIDLEMLKQFKIKNWTKNHDVYRTILRNCVDYRIGKYILDQVGNKIIQTKLI